MASVEEIRLALTEKQNTAYQNYQLQRWIDAKAGIKEDVLKVIRKQTVNERRLKAVLTDPVRLRHTIHDLNRGVLSIVHLKEQHQVVVFVDMRNKAKIFDREGESDSLVLFMYFLLKRIEVLEGSGGHADLVLHQTEAPMPPMNDLRGELAMFSNIVGLSFPGLFDQVILCCGSNSFYRSTCTAMGEQAGLTPVFMSPDDLVTRYGAAHVPRSLGGELDAEPMSMGVQVQRFYQVDCSSKDGFHPDSLPGWDAEEGDEDPEPELFEEGCGVPWATLMANPLQASFANAEKSSVVQYIPTVPRMWLTAILGLAMAGLLNSLFLLAAVVLVLIHVCVSYQSLLRPGSHLLAGGEAVDKFAVAVLEKQLEQLTRLLEPMAMFCVPQLMPTDDKSILAFSTLDREAKLQIKACIQLIQTAIGALPPNASIIAEHTAIYRRAEQMHNWLRTVTTTKVTCVHCGKHGSMDFLDSHLRDRGEAARAKLQHAYKYSSRHRRRHSKVPVPEEKLVKVVEEPAPHTTDPQNSIPAIAELRRISNSMPNLMRSPKGGNALDSPDLRSQRTSVFGNFIPPATASASASTFVPFQNMSSPSTRSSRSDLKITDLGQGYDRNAKQCMACDKKFGAFRRRHWCRRCRKTICAGCAAVSLSSLKRKNPQCMCKPCALECGATVDEYLLTEGSVDHDDDDTE